MRMRIENTGTTDFSVDLWSSLLRIDIWKFGKCSHEHCHVMSGSAAACVCDVTNKASFCGISICDIMSQIFLLFLGKEWTNMAAYWGAKIWGKKRERKKTSVGYTLIEQLYQACKWNSFFYIFLFYFTTILSHWDFCHWKLGLLSPGKASCKQSHYATYDACWVF